MGSSKIDTNYIKFDRRLMSNLDEALQREYIRTNRNGAYYCSTIVDCNTRKYHGALVVPIPEISNNNHVLLSSLDLSIVQHNVPFNIGLHEYPDGHFNPNGQKYIRQYKLDTSSLVYYRVGGAVLSREMFFCHYEHRLILKYTLVETISETTLRFSPFLAFRDVKMLTHENNNINKEALPAKNGQSFCLYQGYPRLYLQLSKENNFIPQPHWNKNVLYRKEKERGYEHCEDLFVPGYFECPIKLGESVYFSVGLEEVDTSSLAEMFEEERKVRIQRDSFRNCLLNSAQQFYYRPNKKDGYILAGYPWFGVRARDLFIALPGCSIYANAPERYERVMKTVKPILERLMRGEHRSSIIENLDHPDVALWAVWSVQQYYKYKGDKSSRAVRVLKSDRLFIRNIINYYLTNQNPYLRIDETSLLYLLPTDLPKTWMDARLDGSAVIPRSGYLVEINALWYNALMFYKEISSKGEWTDEYEILVNNVRDGFKATFLNKHGYLFDSVPLSGEQDWGVRPNMIFAISMPYSPLEISEQKAVLEYVTRELRTPKGLRTLSPNSFGYRGICNGTQRERELAYYNGSIWSWLLGAYFEAYIKLYGKMSISFIEKTLIGMEVEMQEHGLGTISEIFDGSPPYKGRGAISLAMSVGEILRSLYLLDKAKETYKSSKK